MVQSCYQNNQYLYCMLVAMINIVIIINFLSYSLLCACINEVPVYGSLFAYLFACV